MEKQTEVTSQNWGFCINVKKEAKEKSVQKTWDGTFVPAQQHADLTFFLNQHVTRLMGESRFLQFDSCPAASVTSLSNTRPGSLVLF